MKSIYTIPLWPCEASHLWEAAKFQDHLFSCQRICPKLSSWYGSPDSTYSLPPSSLSGGGPSGQKATSRLQQGEADTQASAESLAPARAPATTETFSLRNPELPRQQSLISEMTQRSRKVHVCSSVQGSSSYVLQLRLRNEIGKRKNRSLNSRLAVMFLMDR